VNEMDEPFIMETRIKAIRMRIDTKTQLFRSVDLTLNKKRYLKFKSSFTLAQVPGKNVKIYVPLEQVCNQSIGMLNLPEQFTFKYSDPQFMQPPAGSKGP
jgi:hypothetical protein